MSSVHQEEQFEAAIEAALLARGWTTGEKVHFDPALSLDPHELLTFVRETQPATWQRLVAKRRGSEPDSADAFVRRVAEEIDRRGTLDVLRRGVVDLGETFRLVYFRPTSGITPDLVARYARNRMTVVRQLRYSTATTDELDLAFFVNGIPTHDAELKNQLTGQTVEDAKKQYRKDRSPRERWFAKRTLAHFAVDTSQAFLTTKLAGDDTIFVPFNLGSASGAGNPPAADPDGYATAYLWERVWQRDAWMTLLQRFLHVETTDLGGVERRQVIFPRLHQWDAVLRLVEDARVQGPGQRYLIEHSAGSGKSNTIAWLAYSLMNLHDDTDEPVFDKVVVVSDRRALDQQLRDTIRGFEHQAGIVEAAEHDSKELAAALDSATARVVITTLWKFPVIVERAQLFRDRKYAVIIDEAHSSQTGEASARLRLALGSDEEQDLARAAKEESQAAETDDPEALIARVVGARRRQPNLSFFAFTATPKHRTLELFGTERTPGRFEAFHRYTMRQAIEEGFILDVLENYTTYATYYKVGRRQEVEDPELPERQATRAIARFVSLHERQFDEKAEIVVEHFRQHTQSKIGGEAKAMWVTASRLHAVRSFFALRKYIERKKYPIGVLVAFSGEIEDHGVTYREGSINGFSEAALPDEFKKPAFRILVVAEKYQTGYDQPLLHTMFVDKSLKDVKAVQTLSRLNRMHVAKQDTFVLDFVNQATQIQDAFRPYYEGTVTDATDPNLLYNAAHLLESYGVLRDDEMSAVMAILAKSTPAAGDHARLYRLMDPALARFKNLSEEDQDGFRDAARRYTRLYAFIGQILPYSDADAERRYRFVRALLTVLPRPQAGGLDLGDRLLLTHLRLEKTGTHDLRLDHGQGELPGFGGDGTGSTKPDDPQTHLSALIQAINERFGLNLGRGDQLVLESLAEDMSTDGELIEKAKANDEENFRFGFDRKFEPLVLDRYEANDALFGKILSDPDFADLVRRLIAKDVYTRIRGRGWTAGA